MNDMAETRILLIDEHPVAVRGMRSALESVPGYRVVGVCADRIKALERIERDRPDLVVLEIAIGATAGLDLLLDLKARDLEVRVLCFSWHEEVFYAERALRAGAYGYIMKTAAPESFLKAVRTVLEGRVYLSESMGRRILQRVAMAAEEGRRAPIHRLSNRELQIIHHIGVNRNNRQIARLTGVSLKTVEAHRSKIKEKLHLPTTSDLIRFATNWVEREESFLAEWS